MARIIYLSGSMEGRPYETVKAERDKVAKRLTNVGFFVCDPLRHKWSHFKGGKTKMNLASTDLDITEVIGRDENDIRDCDALLILTGDRPTSGTWLEFGLAVYEQRMPVVVIAPKLRRRMDKYGSKAVGWTGGKATKIVKNLNDAVRFFEWLYGKRYCTPHSDVKV